MNNIFEKYDKKHVENMVVVCRRLDKIFQDLCNHLSVYCWRYQYVEFSKIQLEKPWYDNAKLESELDRYLSHFSESLQNEIEGYLSGSWELAERKNDEILSKILKGSLIAYGGMKVFDLFNRNRPKSETVVLFDSSKLNISKHAFTMLDDIMAMPRRVEALNKFMSRTVEGMNLSDRVWALTAENKSMIEKLLSNGILNGEGAPKIAVTLNQFLQAPDMYFRKIRNPDTGLLEYSATAKEYHPGRGVYRSSLHNARRLAVTEANMAYRLADHQRWLNNPLVVGFEVRLSSSHPVTDMCDDLKGSYPKDFVFTGWHPQCLCVAIPILLTDKEMDRYMNRILNGSGHTVEVKSVKTVKDVPEGFKQWIVNNSERANAKSLPYFYTDNKSFINKIQS
ncbi:MAG: hypothetical protein M1445_09680 [Bacteroidetes bacterium]|nr:hypothetical protein [Bacteroidota bacterium]